MCRTKKDVKEIQIRRARYRKNISTGISFLRCPLLQLVQALCPDWGPPLPHADDVGAAEAVECTNDHALALEAFDAHRRGLRCVVGYSAGAEAVQPKAGASGTRPTSHPSSHVRPFVVVLRASRDAVAVCVWAMGCVPRVAWPAPGAEVLEVAEASEVLAGGWQPSSVNSVRSEERLWMVMTSLSGMLKEK
ncbi:hypothetical protein B0H12DRAFT_1071642 [Mycena haematopus]|nr:hypothetical protein B0H12DRAFT_1071642 [Mycena haematopus]